MSFAPADPTVGAERPEVPDVTDLGLTCPRQRARPPRHSESHFGQPTPKTDDQYGNRETSPLPRRR